MGLSAEERATLKALQDKEKEPDREPPKMSFTLDLGSDTGWERAKKLGLVPDDKPDDDGEDEEEDLADTPRRRGRGDSYFDKR